MAGDKKAGQFKLRAVLQGHSMDVKQVTAVSEPSGALLTASRDKTARWQYKSFWSWQIHCPRPRVNHLYFRLWYNHEDNSFSTKKVYKGHPKYVNCVAFQVNSPPLCLMNWFIVFRTLLTSFPLALSTLDARMGKLELFCLISRTPCFYWRATKRI